MQCDRAGVLARCPLIRRNNTAGTSEIEAVAEDHFGDQVISGSCQSNSKAKIDFPFGRKIQIDRGKNLMLLLADGIEARNGPKGAVVFDATGDFLGEIVTEFEVGRKNDALLDARPVEGAVQSRVEGAVPAAELP